MCGLMYIAVVLAAVTNQISSTPLDGVLTEDLIPAKPDSLGYGSLQAQDLDGVSDLDQAAMRDGGCPEFSELPITDANSTNFIGVRIYTGSCRNTPPLSCNGHIEDLMSGTQLRYIQCKESWCDGHSDAILVGSIYVHPGCKFYDYSEPYYNNNNHGIPDRITEGPASYSCYAGPGQDWSAKIIKSLIVDCRQKMPSCSPSDKWATVGYFDNTQSPLTSTYTYSYIIGTSWSHEISDGFSVSKSVQTTITKTFFKLFEASLSVSKDTGYNWSETSNEAQSEQTSHTVATEVPGGMSIRIQQAKGTCGDSEVQTEMFRSVVTDRKGLKTINIFKH